MNCGMPPELEIDQRSVESSILTSLGSGLKRLYSAVTPQKNLLRQFRPFVTCWAAVYKHLRPDPIEVKSCENIARIVCELNASKGFKFKFKFKNIFDLDLELGLELNMLLALLIFF